MLLGHRPSPNSTEVSKGNLAAGPRWGPGTVRTVQGSIVAVAALTVYDVCKAIDTTMEIGGVRLVTKTGGKSGDWHAPAAAR